LFRGKLNFEMKNTSCYVASKLYETAYGGYEVSG